MADVRRSGGDREALLALYWSSGGPRWKVNRGWAENSTNLGDWYGVSLDEAGRASKIDLKRNGLEGDYNKQPCEQKQQERLISNRYAWQRRLKKNTMCPPSVHPPSFVNTFSSSFERGEQYRLCM